jgi:hypothetical protein
MSTETRLSYRVDRTHIPNLIALAPAPCRMIQVVVDVSLDDDRKVFIVGWSPVVGVLCVVETEYAQRVHRDQGAPHPGATHAEMVDRGWKSCHPWNWFPEVWPVLADGNASDEFALRVAHKRLGPNHLYEAIVPCTWPPEEDRENALRIGRELIQREGERANWVELTENEASPSGTAL